MSDMKINGCQPLLGLNVSTRSYNEPERRKQDKIEKQVKVAPSEVPPKPKKSIIDLLA
jgi:hypothetical protein